MVDTSNFDENDKRPLPIGKNKNVPALFKDELGGKIMIEFVGIRPKTWSYLKDAYDDNDYEKNKIINEQKRNKKVCNKT